MKNLLLRFINLFRRPTTNAGREQGRSVYAEQGQAKDPNPSPVWMKIGILLDTQSRAHAMDEGEIRNLSTSIKAEKLDMALRELRLVEQSTLNGIKHSDGLNEPGDHISADPTEGTESRAGNADDLHLPRE